MPSALAAVEGARALLFERLVDLAHGRREPHPFILHDREGCKASVAFELERLLSTRVPVGMDELAGRERSTVDYGIPDGALTTPGDPEARARLALQVQAAIRAFEPRLGDPQVSVRLAAGRGDALVAEISGWLLMEGQREPVSFAVPLDGGPVDGG
ncbi:MAG: type VI secretion system baseplate subunit TssE [Magnetospirillum sp.]|nr:type VI secretion system baseplate subunit TssE [Magnetospirillum sp.]